MGELLVNIRWVICKWERGIHFIKLDHHSVNEANTQKLKHVYPDILSH